LERAAVSRTEESSTEWEEGSSQGIVSKFRDRNGAEGFLVDVISKSRGCLPDVDMRVGSSRFLRTATVSELRQSYVFVSTAAALRLHL
jgi:hypothetical protein